MNENEVCAHTREEMWVGPEKLKKVTLDLRDSRESFQIFLVLHLFMV